MPFEPLTPQEKKQYTPPCMALEHNPPSHMVITEPMKWRCPACGATVVITPTIIRCG